MAREVPYDLEELQNRIVLQYWKNRFAFFIGSKTDVFVVKDTHNDLDEGEVVVVSTTEEERKEMGFE